MNTIFQQYTSKKGRVRVKKKVVFVSCPYCGGRMRRDAAACPHCGSDDRTGWSEQTYMDGISLPADEDEYNDILESEFGDSKDRPAQMKPRRGWRVAVGLLLLVAFGAVVLRLSC